MDKLDANNLVNGFQIADALTLTVDIQNTGPAGGKVIIEVKGPKHHNDGTQSIAAGVIDVNVDTINGDYTLDKTVYLVSGSKVSNGQIANFSHVIYSLTKLVELTYSALMAALVGNGEGPSLSGFASAFQSDAVDTNPEIGAIVLGMIPETDTVSLRKLLDVWGFEAFLSDRIATFHSKSPLNVILTNIGRTKGILGPDETAQNHYHRFAKLGQAA